MVVYTDYEEAEKNSPFCIALGSFDGVHTGHIKLIETTVYRAKELNCNSMVYTFSQHPKKILLPCNSSEMITDNKNRINIIRKYGLKNIYFDDFENVMNMTPDTFAKEVLVKNFKIRCAVAGYNFTFGSNKEGNADTLKMLGDKYGFEVCIIEPVMVKGNIVSSSLIRDMIKEGYVENVKDYLGRHFSVTGTVIHGMKMGEKIGIRTANISIAPDIVIPHHGVYLTSTVIDNKTYKSVTNIGFNPTFDRDRLSIETHVIGFDGYLYNSEIEVLFLKWQRKEKHFNSVDELRAQINYDISCRLLLDM